MKRTLFFLTAIIAVTFLFSSCAKNEEFQELPIISSVESEANLKSGLTACTNNPFNLIQVTRGMLTFVDMNHFQETLECLEYQLDAQDDAFEAAYGHLTDDEMEIIEGQIGFNDWQPLEDFEAQFSFSSRRKFIEDQIVVWLNNTILDDANDPDELDGLSEELRTLLTIDGKVAIGSTVYDYLDYNEEKSDGCKRFRWQRFFNEYDGNKRYKIKVSFASYPWKTKVKSKIVSYKKKSNGTYKRYRTRLYVQVSASGRDSDCNFPLPMGAFKGPKKRKSLKAKHVTWGPPNWVKFKKNEVHGYATLGNAQYAVGLTLTW